MRPPPLTTPFRNAPASVVPVPGGAELVAALEAGTPVVVQLTVHAFQWGASTWGAACWGGRKRFVWGTGKWGETR
jgi:hypothetical protein